MPDPNRPGHLAILFLDPAVVVVDKPAGLLSVPAPGQSPRTAQSLAEEHLKRREGVSRARLFAVHRLDREASGVLLFARTRQAAGALRQRWHEVSKLYQAWVVGRPQPPEGVIDKPLVEGRDLSVRPARPGQPGARDALTRFRTLCVQGGLALLEVAIETGRKHQIRVHLASLGHPLVGDVRYGGPAWGRRVALHACSLRFPHPVTGQWVEVESRAALDPPVGFR